MRVIIEIDNEAELQKLDPLLRALGTRDVRIARVGHVQKAKDALVKLFAYAKQHPLVVKSLDIPSRPTQQVNPPFLITLLLRPPARPIL